MVFGLVSSGRGADQTWQWLMLMLMLIMSRAADEQMRRWVDAYADAVTPGVTHFAAYHRPSDGHFYHLSATSVFDLSLNSYHYYQR